jgi:hypothetical protein
MPSQGLATGSTCCNQSRRLDTLDVFLFAMDSESYSLRTGCSPQVVGEFFGVSLVFFRYPVCPTLLLWRQVILAPIRECTRAGPDQQFCSRTATWAGIGPGGGRRRDQMKRSDPARVKSFLIFRRKRKRQAIDVAEAACLLESTLAKVPLNGEPELPKHYRHIRSAIGALLILGSNREV